MLKVSKKTLELFKSSIDGNSRPDKVNILWKQNKPAWSHAESLSLEVIS
jgi:hypothetical protein